MNFKKIEDFLDNFLEEKDIAFCKQGKYYFLKNEFFDKINIEPTKNAKSLLLGTENTFFEPSLYLLEVLSKKTKNKIFINEEAEWLFLCGRDVFPKNVVKDDSKKKVFLVQNIHDENLGLGMKTKHKGKKIIKNLKDRGDFLRREKP